MSTRSMRTVEITLMMMMALGGCDIDVQHGSDRTRAEARPGECSNPRDIDDSGYCTTEVHGAECWNASDCPSGYACRTGDSPHCMCRPEPGAAELCATRCEVSSDCPQGHVCEDEEFCRPPHPCVSDDACEDGARCLDVGGYAWNWGGGMVSPASPGPRQCMDVGEAPVGAPCDVAADCASGVCTGRAGVGDVCAEGCVRNDDCATGHCEQLSYGAPACRDSASACAGEGEPEELCSNGLWVRACTTTDQCPEQDCFIDTWLGEDQGFARSTFGVGQCHGAGRCEPGEFRTAVGQTEEYVTCFEHRRCWDDDDCSPSYACTKLDALGTRYCGREVAR